jgi:hypothetical protein
MTTEKTTSRDRSAILAEINAIGNIVAGTLCEFRKGGSDTPLYHIQQWKGGKNVSTHVPRGSVAAVREGIENRKRLEALVAELAAAGTVAALAGDAGDGDKKKRQRQSPVSRARSRGQPSARLIRCGATGSA